MTDDNSSNGGSAPPNRAPSTRASLCALCGKPQVERYTPFCSKRCSDVDLNRWLSGVYAVPAPPTDDDDDDAFQDEPSRDPPARNRADRD
jgi:uncharacterized protein